MQPPGTSAHTGDHPTENPAHFLGLLEELHDSGVLDDDEYTASRTRLLESLRRVTMLALILFLAFWA